LVAVERQTDWGAVGGVRSVLSIERKFKRGGDGTGHPRGFFAQLASGFPNEVHGVV